MAASEEQQDQIRVLCQELAEYLTLIMSPSSSHEVRNTCTKVSSNWCARPRGHDFDRLWAKLLAFISCLQVQPANSYA